MPRVRVVRACFYLLMMFGLLMPLGCQQRPFTPAEIDAQQRFEPGCHGQNAQGYEEFMPYCSRVETGDASR